MTCDHCLTQSSDLQERRRHLSERLAEIESEAAAAAAAHDAAIAVAERETAEARADLARRERALRTLHSEHMDASLRHTRERERLLAELRRTADARIAKAVDQVDADLRETMRNAADAHPRHAQRSERLRAARRALLDLQLKATPAEEVDVIIDGIMDQVG